jgi:hypothetical protein
MLTIKLLKYGDCQPEHGPTYTTDICVRECEAVHVHYDADMRAVLQLGDAPGETQNVTVGAKDCAYSVAYIMNEAGRTVETIR